MGFKAGFLGGKKSNKMKSNKKLKPQMLEIRTSSHLLRLPAHWESVSVLEQGGPKYKERGRCCSDVASAILFLLFLPIFFFFPPSSFSPIPRSLVEPWCCCFPHPQVTTTEEASLSSPNACVTELIFLSLSLYFTCVVCDSTLCPQGGALSRRRWVGGQRKGAMPGSR